MMFAPRHLFTVGIGALLALSPAARVDAAPSESLQACIARCNKSKLSETNRETCRLDCELDAATDPEAIQAEVERRRPQPQPQPTAGTGGASVTTPAPTPTPAAGGREGCKAQCEADRSLSRDDRATCKLECDQSDEPGGASAPANPGAGAAATVGAGPSATGPGAAGPIVAVPTSARPLAAPGTSPSGFLAMCFQTCRSGPVRLSPTDQETCRLTCEDAASFVELALDAAPLWFSPPAGLAAAPQPAAVAPATTPAVIPVSAKPVAPGKPATPPVAAPVAAPAQGCDGARDTCTGACDKVRGGCERGCKQKNATDRETCKLECSEGVSLCRADCISAHATCVNKR